jgi:hypothetical protein
MFVLFSFFISILKRKKKYFEHSHKKKHTHIYTNEVVLFDKI